MLQDIQIKIDKDNNWHVGYYAHLYKRLKNGWDSKKEFLTLNFLHKGVNNCVYFPYIDELLSDQDFILKAKQLVVGTPFDTDFFISNEFHNFKQTKLHSDIEFGNKIKFEFENVKKDLINILNDIFELEYKSINVEIYPTTYGSIGTFINNYSPEKIKSTLRNDQNLSSLIKIIIYNIVYGIYINQNVASYKWHNTESIIDFLMTSTKLSSLYPQNSYRSLLKSLASTNTDSDLWEESRRYTNDLGFNFQNETKIDVNGNIYINNIQIKNLSPNEEIVLKLLIEFRGKTCSYDVISDMLYKEKSSEKFSAQYIAKLIEELRNSLHESGISRSFILTKRKKGYLIL